MFHIVRKFKKIYIEITNVCNLNCSFCSKSSRKPEFMKLDSFSAILDEIKPFTSYIYLHVKGEPLLHPELDKILNISCNKGFKVNLTTNGTLLKNATSILLSGQTVRQINISLHSFDEQLDTKYKNDYLNNIVVFVKEALETTNMYISLRLWNLNKESDHQLANNEYIIKSLIRDLCLPFPTPEIIKPGKNIKLADRLFMHFEYEFTWPDLNDSNDNLNGFCLGLRDQVAILADGTVVPCCLDGEGIIDLGNIFTEHFNEILSSDRSVNIYNGFSASRSVEKLCRKCHYKERFQ